MSDLQTFFSMGGYGAYVWSAYAITFLVIVLNLVLASRDYRQQLRHAQQQQRRVQRRRQEESTTAGQADMQPDLQPANQDGNR